MIDPMITKSILFVREHLICVHSANAEIIALRKKYICKYGNHVYFVFDQVFFCQTG